MSQSWVVWSLLAALFGGATAVLAKLGVTGINSNLATAIRTTVILVFAWGVAFATIKPAEIASVTTRTWLFLVFSGLATGLSWLCYFRALKLGPATQVATVDKLSIIFVIVFAAMFLNEPLTMKTGMGAVLIVAGTMILAWK